MEKILAGVGRTTVRSGVGFLRLLGGSHGISKVEPNTSSGVRWGPLGENTIGIWEPKDPRGRGAKAPMYHAPYLKIPLVEKLGVHIT